MRILNIGSLNIDKTYRTEHFVRPGETIKISSCEQTCGGKGLNQSIALARAGAKVFHAGAIGADGIRLKREMAKALVDTSLLDTSDVESGHAVIQVDANGQNSIIVCGGANDSITEGYVDEVLSYFQEGDYLLLQNEVNVTAYAMKEAKKKGMKIVLNPSPITDKLFEFPLHLVDYFILNEIEGEILADVDSSDSDKIIEGLKERYPRAAFVLTLGENGSIYADKHQMYRQEIFRTNVVDTTGAGDTFCGYFLATLATADVQDALCKASAASAIAVSRKGAAPSIPTMSEVNMFLNA